MKRPARAALQPPSITSRATRYSLIAQALLEDITSGRFRVGATLPSEAELQKKFGAGRHTVREAIRQLRHIGMLTARAGVGTIVTAASPSRRYTQSMNSVAELLHFTKTTRLRVLAKQSVTADDKLAEVLHCPPGQEWFEMELLRTSPRIPAPLALVRVYVRPEFQGVAQEVESHHSVFSRIEERFGVQLFELEQEISCCHLSAPVARKLKARPGSAALKILRHYYAADQRVTEVSVGLYPEGRFSYTTRMRLNLENQDGPLPR